MTKSCSCTTGGWHGSLGSASPGRWPRSTPATLTGTRSPGWCSAAAPRGWPCASPADERTRKLARRRLPPRRPGPLPGSTRKGLFPRWHAFVRQYRDPMQLVLLAAGIGSLYPLKQLGTGLLLILLTLFNAVMGLQQEGKAAAAVAALQKMVIIKARVAFAIAAIPVGLPTVVTIRKALLRRRAAAKAVQPAGAPPG